MHKLVYKIYVKHERKPFCVMSFDYVDDAGPALEAVLAVATTFPLTYEVAIREYIDGHFALGYSWYSLQDLVLHYRMTK